MTMLGTPLSVHRLRGPARWLALPVFAFMLLVGGTVFITSLANGQVAGVGFMVVWLGILFFNGWRMIAQPNRIEVLDEGLRLVRTYGTVEVPWGSLRSVESPSFDIYGMVLRWRWDGGRLTTQGRYSGQRALLAAIEAHAPHVHIGDD